MTGISFGTLTEASLREAWPHEAHSFTPWLAANLDRIAAAIGMPLELVDTEVAVTSFSADILAKSVETGSFVLIENQLEEGDHLHLGQILTYLAGLKAETVVWVASKFRDAHLSAIRWLNEHTVEPYAFFAVKVRVVRIGQSPYAPLFDVIEGPSNWDRQVQEIARESKGTTDLGEFRRAFWANYLSRHGAGPSERGGGAGSSRWRRLSDGSTMVIQYVAKHSVGVFVRPETNDHREAMLARLLPHAAELETRLGVTFSRGGGDGYLLVSSMKGDTSDRSNWDSMADWLKVQGDRFVEALEAVLAAGSGTDAA